ncbi:MAG: NlpC/P60 family protein [Herbinix sp.]|nr:NlpC/P60 family protein [Herbinix sp.]
MRKIQKLAPYLLIGTLLFSGNNAFALATEEKATVENATDIMLQTSEEPIAGINLVLNEVYQNTDNAEKEIVQYLPLETEYDNLAFAQVTNYVNIRSKANENGEILGKLYNNSVATIISHKDGWYQIKSGSVKGYIKAEFLITGEEAEKLANSIGNRVAEVTTTTLKVREKASTDAEVLTLVAQGDDLKIVKELEGWVKVYISQDERGYVSSDYVKVQTVYEEAVSIQEEQERLEEEAAADNQALSTSNNSQVSTNNTSSKSSSSSSTSSGNSASSNSSSSSNTASDNVGSSSLGSKIASYAIQFEGNPYVWGGTSLTNGADCSGFTQSVFAHFGINIPRTSRTQAAGGMRVSLDNLQQGDLIFYTRSGTINHVALYIGNGKVISASSPSTGIRITRYNYRQPYKAVRYINS